MNKNKTELESFSVTVAFYLLPKICFMFRGDIKAEKRYPLLPGLADRLGATSFLLEFVVLNSLSI